MLDAAGMEAELNLTDVPAYPQATALAQSGIASTLLPENLSLACRLSGDELPSAATLAVLFDPQTSGGLVAGVPAARAQACIDDLKRNGMADACIVGDVLRSTGDRTGQLRLRGTFTT